MKNVMFFGGASMLSFIWANHWSKDYNIYLGLNKRWIEIPGTQSILLPDSYEELKTILKKKQIDLLINCAGLSNVEECENNIELAYELNSLLPGNLSKITNELKVKFIHISTDHLYSDTNKMYTEITKVHPLNTYAKSKHDGEQRVIKNNKNALIIRTNFFGKGPSYKPSFSDSIISSLIRKKNIYLFNNVYYTPIHVYEMAKKIIDLLKIKASGVYNICSNERITKYEFGIMLAKKLNLPSDLIIPIKIEEKKNLVLRPKDMSLSNNKLKNDTNSFVNSILIQLNYLI